MHNILLKKIGQTVKYVVNKYNQQQPSMLKNEKDGQLQKEIIKLLNQNNIIQRIMYNGIYVLKIKKLEPIFEIMNQIQKQICSRFKLINEDIKSFMEISHKIILNALLLYCHVCVNNKSPTHSKIELIIPENGQSIDRTHEIKNPEIRGHYEIGYVVKIGHKISGDEKIKHKPLVYGYFMPNEKLN